MNYFYTVNGQQAGPLPEDELRQLVASGQVPADTLIWREGMADWQPFSTALGSAPKPAGMVECTVCRGTFPADETIQYGTVRVCAGCKPRFVQGLKEGATPGAMMDFAGIGARFLADIVDGILMMVVSFGVSMMVGTSQDPALIAGATAINFIVPLIYQISLLGWRGQTLGKMALGVKVVNADGTNIGWGKAIGRPLAEMLSGCLLCIGYIIAFFDEEKRTLHDRICGTRVIKVSR